MRSTTTNPKTKVASALGMAFLLIALSSRIVPTSASTTLTPKEYAALMNQFPPPGPGCWYTTFPSTTWNSEPCAQPNNSTVPAVGDGTDYYAGNGSTHIEYAQGDFASVSGITSESDSSAGSDYYALQINSNG